VWTWLRDRVNDWLDTGRNWEWALSICIGLFVGSVVFAIIWNPK